MDNLNDIISSLSADDINMLKGVASSILGGNDGDNTAENTELPANNHNQHQNSKNQSQNKSRGQGSNALASFGLNTDDFNMMMKAKTIFDKMNSSSNKNTDLIMALKPHLAPEHQAKADTAIKILRLFDVLPYLKDLF